MTLESQESAPDAAFKPRPENRSGLHCTVARCPAATLASAVGAVAIGAIAFGAFAIG
jgi:hypothetical protein